MDLSEIFSNAELPPERERLLFPPKTVVQFKIIDYTTLEQHQSMVIKTTVLTGEHKGKQHDIFLILDQSKEIGKANAAMFAMAFWTAAEREAKEVNPAKIIGRKLQAISTEVKQGKYQNWKQFKDLGPMPDDESSEIDNAAEATSF